MEREINGGNRLATIPIIFVQAADPVSLGLVDNLAVPEGNVTGFVLFEPSIGGKWVQLLHDVAPNVREILVMQAAGNPSSAGFMQAIKAVAPTFGVEISTATVHDRVEIEPAIANFSARPNAGMIVLPGPIFSVHRERMIAAAQLHKVPCIYAFPYYTREGGLMSYSPDNIDQWRQAASYVDRILRGARTRDLPIQLPTKFDLIINLKTAKALGLTIQRDVLLIADEVIE
jgi:putative ABC transport system substrate-binding protein